MALVTLYTAVPVNRILSIQKHGLVTNDKVSTYEGFNEDKYLNGRTFEESMMGYIYASTNLSNAIEWGTIITIQTRYTFLILEYKINENTIEKDIASLDKNIFDVRFKGHVRGKNITVIMGELVSYEKGKHELVDIERKSLSKVCEELEVNCENCNKLFKYKDMKYLTNVILCEECEENARRVTLEESQVKIREEIQEIWKERNRDERRENNQQGNENTVQEEIQDIIQEEVQEEGKAIVLKMDSEKSEEINQEKNEICEVAQEENVKVIEENDHKSKEINQEEHSSEGPVVEVNINKFDMSTDTFEREVTLEDIKEKFDQRNLLLKELRDIETETEEMMVALEKQTYDGKMCMEYIDETCKSVRKNDIEININGRFMNGKYFITEQTYIFISCLVCPDFPKHENIIRYMVGKGENVPIPIEYRLEVLKLEEEIAKYKIINVSKNLIEENVGRDSFQGLWNYCNRTNRTTYDGHY